MTDRIDRYVRGELSPEEARALAQASLESPALFDELTDAALAKAALNPRTVRAASVIRTWRRTAVIAGGLAAAAAFAFFSLPQMCIRDRTPGLLPDEARERASGNSEDVCIDLHDVFMAVPQDVIVRVNRGHVAMDDDRVEVKVSQAADGGELVIVQIRGRRSHGWRGSGGRGGDGRVQNNRPCGRGGDASGGVGTGRDTEVECVHQLVAGRIVDTNLAGLANPGRAGEGQYQMRVGIDAGRMIRRETGNGGIGARRSGQGKGGKHAKRVGRRARSHGNCS